MALYDRLGPLPLTIEGHEFERREEETANGFTRSTTIVSLYGDGLRGRGEDVIYEPAAHDRYEMPMSGVDEIDTFDDVHRRLNRSELLPDKDWASDVFRNYRQWAFESAALDLALRQRGESLAGHLERSYQPVRFVVSPSLGDPPTMDRINRLLDANADLEFKLDPSEAWSDDLIDELVEIDAVRILDLKGLYEDEDLSLAPDAAMYSRLLDAFPAAIIEDPAVTDGTIEVLESATERLSWDYPIRGPRAIDTRTWPPQWLNIKPSRIGSVKSLCATLEAAKERDIALYGGGQFELDIGREQLHAIASLFYPSGPNDIAPTGYNTPGPRHELPSSPLEPPSDPIGLSWT